MSANGESPRKLLQGALGDHFLQLQWSPDGQQIAYLRSRNENNKSETIIEALPLAGGISSRVLAAPDVRSFCWSSDGRIIYSRQEPPPNDSDMNLWELRIDLSRAKPQESPRRITNWAGLSLLDLSISADGKHLVFVNAGLQRDIFLAGLAGKGQLEPPRRLTLQGRNNLPSAWTPDGQSLFFYSDRNGSWDIFRQRVLERNAQDFVLGPGEQTEPRLSSDASSILYWDFVERSGEPEPIRLMRISVSGGAPDVVLKASRGAAVRCALGHTPCVLSELDRGNGELVFTAFNSRQGRMKELVRLAADAEASPAWDLSPDGSTVSIVDLDERKNLIRMVELENGSARSVALGPTERLTGISWSADGKGWFVTSSSLRGAALFHVSLDGTISKLWTTNSNLVAPLTSPDGKNLAFATSTYNSNAWILEKF